MSPRWPRGLHLPAGSVLNRGGRSYRGPSPPIASYGRRVRALLDLSGTVVLNSLGGGFVQLTPAGTGNIWHVEQVDVSTTTGQADQSQAVIYHGGVTPNTVLGRSAQAGGDTLSFSRRLAPGEIVICVWSGGNPGDTATLRVVGEQDALA